MALLFPPGSSALPVSPWPKPGAGEAGEPVGRSDARAAAPTLTVVQTAASPPALAAAAKAASPVRAAGAGALSAGPAAAPATPAAQDEAALRQGALAGDPACWSALIARYNHKVVVSVLARGIALERAKELAQETWMRLIESQRAGRLQELVLPGLAIVQAGYLAAHARRSACRDERAQDEKAQTVAAVAHAAAPAPPEEQVIQRQRLLQLERALSSCPAGARRVFEFVYAHPELTYDELATELQLSAQRVKQIVCEVRKRLRAAVEECEP